MDRHSQHIGPFVEDLLRAIAMMDVYVENGDAAFVAVTPQGLG